VDIGAIDGYLARTHNFSDRLPKTERGWEKIDQYGIGEARMPKALQVNPKGKCACPEANGGSGGGR